MSSIISNEILLQPTSDIIFDDDLIVLRNEQVAQLFQMLNPGSNIQPAVETRFHGDALKYIWGWKGTGKTTMLKWYEKKVHGLEAQCIYINCRTYNKANHLFQEILRRLMELNPDHTSKETQLRSQIVDYISVIKDKQTFLLLDEIDKPLRNSKTTQQDEFLHYLIRLVSDNKYNLFKLIFSTNVTNIERFMSDEVISYLGANKIQFGVYTVPEIVEILEKRCQKALLQGTFEKKDLYMIAHVTHTAFDGDIRTALTMLHKLAKKSENILDMTKLDSVMSEINQAFLQKEVFSFPKGVQILLKSILAYQGNSDEFGARIFTADEAYEKYVKYCEQENYKPSQKVMFYRYINTLLDSMILTRKSTGYQLSEDPKKLSECLAVV
jgi:Cdc6-like AAA superfamily ATPase